MNIPYSQSILIRLNSDESHDSKGVCVLSCIVSTDPKSKPLRYAAMAISSKIQWNRVNRQSFGVIAKRLRTEFAYFIVLHTADFSGKVLKFRTNFLTKSESWIHVHI
jgi:hypothetical protein